MTQATNMIPQAPVATVTTRFNALQHGILSDYTVLPWEDAEAYAKLVAALVSEHAPRGPTEEHLVEELAGILWRKRRLRLAEAAAFRRGLSGAMTSYRETGKVALAHLDTTGLSTRVPEAVQTTDADTEDEMRDVEADEAITQNALNLLTEDGPDGYARALAALREDTVAWWETELDPDQDGNPAADRPYTPDATGLRRFLETEVRDWFAKRKQELANRPLIRDQAFGEALDDSKLERLGRYEVHLDRKLERMLTMLIRLKDLRQAANAG